MSDKKIEVEQLKRTVNVLIGQTKFMMIMIKIFSFVEILFSLLFFLFGYAFVIWAGFSLINKVHFNFWQCIGIVIVFSAAVQIIIHLIPEKKKVFIITSDHPDGNKDLK